MADPSESDIYDAIRAADAAGDSDSVQKLSDHLQAMRAGGATPQPQVTPYDDGSGWKPDTSPAHSQAVQAAYDAMPWYAKAGTAIGDTARLMAHGFTGGMNNRFLGDVSGAFTGDYTTDYRAREQGDADARIRAPVAGTVADALGTTLGVGKIMPAERATQAAFPLTQAGVAIPRFLSRVGLGAGENVALNAANNIGQGDLPQKNWETAAGVGAGATSVLSPALTRIAGAIGGRLPGMTIDNTPVPTAPPPNYRGPPMDTFQSRKTAAYDTVGQHAPYNPADLVDPVLNARAEMTGMGLHTNPVGNTQSLHPGSLAHLTGMENRVFGTGNNNSLLWSSGSRNPTPLDLDAELQAIARDTEGTKRDVTLSGPLRRNIQGILDNTPTTAGQIAGPDLAAARRANARYENSGMLDQWHEADLNNPKSIAVLPGKARYELDTLDRRSLYNPDEIQALQSVARGGPLAKGVDFVASHPWTGSAAAAIGTQLLTGSPAHAAIGAVAYPLASFGAKALSKASTSAAMDTARRVLTDTPQDVNLASNVLNSGASRDRLNAILMGLYNR